MTSTKF